MKHLFLIMVLLSVLFLSSCKYIRVKNIDVIEDPNRVTIVIDKGLE